MLGVTGQNDDVIPWAADRVGSDGHGSEEQLAGAGGVALLHGLLVGNLRCVGGRLWSSAGR